MRRWGPGKLLRSESLKKLPRVSTTLPEESCNYSPVCNMRGQLGSPLRSPYRWGAFLIFVSPLCLVLFLDLNKAHLHALRHDLILSLTAFFPNIFSEIFNSASSCWVARKFFPALTPEIPLRPEWRPLKD